MPLLSRAAEHLYWLGRHLERIEATVRVVEEHTNLLVDLPIEVESDWSSLVAMVGGQQPFADRGLSPAEADVVHYLLHDRANPSSVASTVAAARENLRVTRQLVPPAGWECLNRLHLTLGDAGGTYLSRSQNLAVCQAGRVTCQQITGIMSLYMGRDQGWFFYEVGRCLERADMTARLLDARVGAIMAGAGTSGAGSPAEPADRSPFEDVRWLGLLRAADGLDLYHRCTTTPVEAASVVHHLLGEGRSPRSVLWCLAETDRALHALPPRKLPTLACANALSIVERGIPLPLSREGFHLHIDALQLALEAIHEAVNDAWFVAGQSVWESGPRAPVGRP